MEGKQLAFEGLEPEYAPDALRYYDDLALEGMHDPDVEEFCLAVLDAELATRSNDDLREIGWLNSRQIQLRMKMGQVITYEMQKRHL